MNKKWIIYSILKKWRDRHSVLRLSYDKSGICYTYHPVHEDDDRPYLFNRGRELNGDFIFAMSNREIAPPSHMARALGLG